MIGLQVGRHTHEGHADDLLTGFDLTVGFVEFDLTTKLVEFDLTVKALHTKSTALGAKIKKPAARHVHAAMSGHAGVQLFNRANFTVHTTRRKLDQPRRCTAGEWHTAAQAPGSRVEVHQNLGPCALR